MMNDIQGTVGWLTSRIDLRTEHAIRKELRALEREADAALVVLYVPVGVGSREVIASAGEFATMPIRLPEIDSTKPSFETVRVDAGTRELAVVHQVTVGRRVVKMVLAVIAPGVEPNGALLDAVEDCAARIEDVLVERLSRVGSA